MQQRNIVMCIILSIVTCGIYGLYWFYSIANELYNAKQDTLPTTPVITLIVNIVSCGIYGIYVYYKWGKDIPEICAEKGVTVEDRSIVYIILSICGLAIINLALIQNDFNLASENSQQ